MTDFTTLSRRERQLLEVVYKLGNATAQQVLEQLEDPPGYSAVRKWLSILEEKGHLRHRKNGRQYCYVPVEAADKARISALRHLTETFFHGSRGQAAVALLRDAGADLSDSERAEIIALIEERAREEA